MSYTTFDNSSKQYRFRDSGPYNSIQYDPTVPLGVNPYLYAENNPVMKKDLSGMSAQWYRGVRMGDKSVYLGTRPPSNPNQIYDCCSEESPLLD